MEENATGDIELHLQSMRVAGDMLFYGWKGGDYYGRMDNINHRIFDWNDYGDLRSDARPVLRLDQLETDIILTLVGEVESSGIHMSRLRITGNGYNTVDDLDDAIAVRFGLNPCPPVGSLGFTQRVSTSTAHQYPVIINTPSSYGGSVKNYIYFAENSAYLPKLKQFDISANSTSTINLPSEFSSIYSLQGGSSPANASFALCIRTSAYLGGPNVVVYERPSYGGSPQLKTVYRGYDHPTIMVDQQTGFNSSGSGHTVMMQGNDANWYWADGSKIEFLDSEIAGVFSREKVNTGDREVIVIRNDEIPTMLEKFGSGLILGKVVSSNTDIRYYRYWSDNKNNLSLSVLDFHGAKVQIIDSLKTNNNIITIELLETGLDGFIVRQPDTLISDIGVKVLRNNKEISSFAPSRFAVITSFSLAGVRPGDILLFESRTGTKTEWAFAELTFRGSTFQKESIEFSEDPVDENLNIISAYPNPFNPATTFSYTLKNSGRVKLSIYDIRGRLVENLVNSFKPAGRYNVTFGGNHLASGIYIYRFETDMFVKTDKLMLIK